LGNLREVFSFLSAEIPGKEHLMAKHGNVKGSDKFEALRRKEMNKSRAANITNSGKSGSPEGRTQQPQGIGLCQTIN
jgi:hypothetical protein